MTAADAETLAPDVKLAGPLSATAHAELSGGKATVTLDAQGGGGTIALRARGDPFAARPTYKGKLTVKKVDPSRLLPDLPPGSVGAELDVDGSGLPPDEDVHVSGAVTPKLRGVPGERAVLDVRARGREVKIARLEAEIAGAEVSATGTVSPEHVNATVHADVPDAAALVRALERETGKKLPAVSGSAKLDARVVGPPKTPAVDFTLRSPSLRYAQNRATALTVEAHLHGLPKHAKGTFTARAAHLALGKTAVDSLTADGSLEDRQVDWKSGADVSGGHFTLGAHALLDEDFEGAELSALDVGYPEATFALVAPTHVRSDARGLDVQPLRLHGDHGDLSARAKLGPRGELDADVGVAAFDLAFLPKAFVDPALKLAGKVDLRARATGVTRHPLVEAKLGVKGGAALGYEGVDVDAAASVGAERLRATAELSKGPPLLGTRVKLTADLPRELTAAEANDPVSATLDATGLRVSDVRERMPDSPLQGGTGEVHVKLGGRFGEPHATGTIALHRLDTTKLKGVEAELAVELKEKLAHLRLSASIGGAPALALGATTAVDAYAIARDPRRAKALAEQPLDVTLAVPEFPLAVLTAQGLLPEKTTGRFSAKATVRGTPKAPVLDSDFALDDVDYGAYHGLAAHASFDAGAKGAKVLATLRVAHEEAGALTFETPATPEAALAGKDLLDVPVRAHLDIPRIKFATAAGFSGEPPFDGLVSGKLDLTGTAAKPVLEGKGELTGARAGAHGVGDYLLTLAYRDTHGEVAVFVKPPAGGALSLTAKANADLGARAIAKLDPKALPLDVTLAADRLDLAFLAGLAPRVRHAEGKLDGRVVVTGTLAAPVPRGKLALAGGNVDLVAVGQLRDLGLTLALQDDGYFLKGAHVQQLGGTLDLEAALRPVVPGWDFDAHAHSSKYPIVLAGEPAAFIDSVCEVGGHYEPNDVKMTVKLPQTNVVIPNLPKKKLQSLSSPSDVQTVEERAALAKKKARLHEAEQAPFLADVRLIVPDRFFIHGPDFDAEVRADVTAHYDSSAEDVLATGELSTVGGEGLVSRSRVTALGRRFDLDRVHVMFTGGPIDDPRLDVRATYVNPNATVTASLTGSAMDPHIDLSSDPPMDTAEIAFLLATGRKQGRATQGGGGVDLQGAAASAFGAVMVEGLKRVFKATLPLDVLSVEGAGDTGGVATKGGVYVTDRLFLGGTVRVGGGPQDNNVEAHGEYQLGKSATVEATIGDRGTGGVDILYSKDF